MQKETFQILQENNNINMKKINIAIIGLGNIGSHLYKYLNENKKILTEKNNCIPVVKYISARNKKRKDHLN